MKTDWMTRAISDFHLERYSLGELPPAIAQAIEKRLAGDPALRARLEALRDHDARFRDAHPAAATVARIRSAAASAPAAASAAPARPAQRAQPGPAPFAGRALPFLPAFSGWRLAAGFALLALAAVPLFLRDHDATVAEVRFKGAEPELRLYRYAPSGAERLAPGAHAAAGDVVQIEFHPDDYPYGAILSVDGAGAVTRHWPKPPDTATALSAFRQYRLDEAFRLDAAPKFERFHLLLSRSPIDLAALTPLVAASAGENGDWLEKHVPASIRIASFTLAK